MRCATGIYRTRGAALHGKFALKRAWKRFLRRRLRRELDSLSDHLLADVAGLLADAWQAYRITPYFN